MSVLACERQGCDNVMCDHLIHGKYICRGCLHEFSLLTKPKELSPADHAQNFLDFMSRPAMPRYKCHKEVRALKIDDIAFSSDGIVIVFEDARQPEKRLSRDWWEKHRPATGGYLVVYDDGYESYSPAKAFEEGYTRIRT